MDFKYIFGTFSVKKLIFPRNSPALARPIT